MYRQLVPRVGTAVGPCAPAMADAPVASPGPQAAFSGSGYLYTANGGHYVPQVTETVAQRYTFTGREAAGPAAAAAGAPMYYRYRMYSPGLGRFGRRDPWLGGDQQYNAYGLPGSDGVNHIDPHGEQAQEGGRIIPQPVPVPTPMPSPAPYPGNLEPFRGGARFVPPPPVPVPYPGLPTTGPKLVPSPDLRPTPMGGQLPLRGVANPTGSPSVAKAQGGILLAEWGAKGTVFTGEMLVTWAQEIDVTSDIRHGLWPQCLRPLPFVRGWKAVTGAALAPAGCLRGPQTVAGMMRNWLVGTRRLTDLEGQRDLEKVSQETYQTDITAERREITAWEASHGGVYKFFSNQRAGREKKIEYATERVGAHANLVAQYNALIAKVPVDERVCPDATDIETMGMPEEGNQGEFIWWCTKGVKTRVTLPPRLLVTKPRGD